MRLADMIIGAQGDKRDKAFLGAITAVAPSISNAQRFVFSPETIGACNQLSQSKPSSLLDVQPRCRAPFKFTWMEWGGNVPGREKDSEWYSKDVIPTRIPDRFGALIECLDDTNQRFGVSFFWNFGENIHLCPLGVIINWHDRWQPMDRLNALRKPTDIEREVLKSWRVSKFLNDPKELDALKQMDKRVVSVVAPHMDEFVEAVKRQQSFEATERYISSSARDLAGEVAILQAALCLMNSRNCVAIEQVDLKKLNAARRRQMKKPMLSYSTVTINLSKSEQRVAQSQNLSALELRQHIVRGHFKLRKSGVYWWRPFLRGKIKNGRVIRSGYQVEGVPA